jgi:hypothetical protein
LLAFVSDVVYYLKWQDPCQVDFNREESGLNVYECVLKLKEILTFCLTKSWCCRVSEIIILIILVSGDALILTKLWMEIYLW